MQNRKRLISLLLIILVTALVTAAMAALRAQDQVHQPNHQSNRAQRAEFESQFPIADYDTRESTDPNVRIKRQAKGSRYSRTYKKIGESQNVREITESESWIERLPALPISQSNIIITGEIADAQAFVIADRTNVYSEFTILIDDVLKSDDSSLYIGSTLIADREGGQVRFPSGHVQLYLLSGEGAPHVGEHYVLFLKRQPQDFLLLTGYELRAGCVYPIDSVMSHTVYQGMDQEDFLGRLRKAIATSPQGR